MLTSSRAQCTISVRNKRRQKRRTSVNESEGKIEMKAKVTRTSLVQCLDHGTLSSYSLRRLRRLSMSPLIFTHSSYLNSQRNDIRSRLSKRHHMRQGKVLGMFVVHIVHLSIRRVRKTSFLRLAFKLSAFKPRIALFAMTLALSDVTL